MLLPATSQFGRAINIRFIYIYIYVPYTHYNLSKRDRQEMHIKTKPEVAVTRLPTHFGGDIRWGPQILQLRSLQSTNIDMKNPWFLIRTCSTQMMDLSITVSIFTDGHFLPGKRHLMPSCNHIAISIDSCFGATAIQGSICFGAC